MDKTSMWVGMSIPAEHHSLTHGATIFKRRGIESLTEEKTERYMLWPPPFHKFVEYIPDGPPPMFFEQFLEQKLILWIQLRQRYQSVRDYIAQAKLLIEQCAEGISEMEAFYE